MRGAVVAGSGCLAHNPSECILQLFDTKPIDDRIKTEQNKNIKGQETEMTEILRDVAAFASMAVFVSSMTLLMMAL